MRIRHPEADLIPLRYNEDNSQVEIDKDATYQDIPIVTLPVLFELLLDARWHISDNKMVKKIEKVTGPIVKRRQTLAALARANRKDTVENECVCISEIRSD